MTLLLAGGAAAGPARAEPAGGTAVYQHDGGTGDRLLLDAPAHRAAFFNLRDFARGCVLWNCTTWDNTVSSISVRSFGSMTLFAGADATGDCSTYVNNTDVPRSYSISQFPVALTSASPASATGTWNDLASSVIVTTAEATPDPSASRCPVAGNPTFATGFEDPAGLSLPWESEGAAAKGINIRGGVAQTGWNNAWIRTSSTGWNAISRQDLRLRPKMGYVIRAWVQTSPNLRNGHMGLRPAGSVVPYRGVAFGASPPGQYRLIEVRLPARQVGYTFFLGYWGQHGEDSWVRIDNISVQQDDLASLT